MKYKTLNEYIQAGETGPMVIDNDTVTAYSIEAEELLYEAHPEDVLCEALELLGIKHDHV